MTMTRCTGGNCPLVEQCVRFVAELYMDGHKDKEFFSEPPWDEDKKDCEYFIDNERVIREELGR